MRGLLLSAYAAASHQQWAYGVMHWLDEVDWTLLELPPRHFAWRIRGNPLTWMLREGEALAREYDVLLATSMVDLATLVGLYPQLGQAHKIVYFHENQFAYPLPGDQQSPRGEPVMVNLYTALTADTLVFNSAYNRDSFIDGARAFLKRLPENLPAAAPLEGLRDRARILPVPIAAETSSPSGGHGNIIVWNHRWEYDKNPESFFRALFGLVERGVDFRLAVMGQCFGDWPVVFDEAYERLKDHLVCWGPQTPAVYRHWLDEAAMVVSTTYHEFQGLAIMEAVQRGCVPLVPDRLCFPDMYADSFRYRDDAELEQRLADWLTEPANRPLPPDCGPWTWPALLPAYRDLLGEVQARVGMKSGGAHPCAAINPA